MTADNDEKKASEAKPETETKAEATVTKVAPAAERPGEDDPLHKAWSALDRGDHVEAKALALVARDAAKDPRDREAAEAFLKRLAPDPVIVAVFAMTGLLIVILAMLYLKK